MNKYDWYFQQIVNQSEMDQAFQWAENAMHSMMLELMGDSSAPGGGQYGGIIEGGQVSEQTVPDLTVAVSQIAAWGKSGERIYNGTPSTNVDCSADEFGTSSEVTTPGESRIISVFARYKVNPQDPAVDGNGLTVYTKQLESMEFFVRISPTAVTPVPPALLSDSLLLVDITRAQGQSTIQNSDMDLSRREDWVRFSGANISSFVHGSSKEAIRDIFGYLDSIWGTTNPFSFSEDWYGAVAVGVVGGAAPTDVGEALDAIIEDLASTGTGGGLLVGAQATTGTPGGYGDFAATSVSQMLANIANLTSTHINSATLRHTAADVDSDAHQDFLFIATDQTLIVGPVINSAGGTGDVVSIGQSYSAILNWALIANLAGSWPSNVGIDNGTGPYTAPPDAWLLSQTTLSEDMMTGGDLQVTLEAMTNEINSRPRISDDAQIHGQRISHDWNQNLWLGYNHCALSGGGQSNRPAVSELKNGYYLTGSLGMWGHAYQSKTTVSPPNVHDICRGWHWQKQQPCVYVIGDPSGGEVRISRVYVDRLDSDYINDDSEIMTDSAGNNLISTVPNADPHAICSDGKFIYVLVDVGSLEPRVYCYDARSFGTGSLRFVWDTTIAGRLLSSRKTDSRIRVNGSYVFCLLGGEDTEAGGSGTPLARMNVSDGSGGISGRGDGNQTAVAGLPVGGLYVSRSSEVFYSSFAAGQLEIIPATSSLGSTGVGTLNVSGGVQLRDLVIPGGRYVFASGSGVGGGVGRTPYWDWISDVKISMGIDGWDNSFPNDNSQCDFDGTKIWVKYPGDNGSSGKNYILVGIHAAELRREGTWTYSPARRYQLNTPTIAGPAIPGGRICAWGHGVFNIDWEGIDNEIGFLPFSRLS